MAETPRTSTDELSDPRWFREPTRREHAIAAGLFIGFGGFFTLLFLLQSGWWFRWVILGLAVFSIMRGLRHLIRSIYARGSADAR
jgi:hypothetical protein